MCSLNERMAQAMMPYSKGMSSPLFTAGRRLCSFFARSSPRHTARTTCSIGEARRGSGAAARSGPRCSGRPRPGCPRPVRTATRSRFSGVCRTRAGVGEALQVLGQVVVGVLEHQLPQARLVVGGQLDLRRPWPARSAWEARSEPSRWTCRSVLGIRRMNSGVIFALMLILRCSDSAAGPIRVILLWTRLVAGVVGHGGSSGWLTPWARCWKAYLCDTVCYDTYVEEMQRGGILRGVETSVPNDAGRNCGPC